jgi:ribosome-binding factor A
MRRRTSHRRRAARGDGLPFVDPVFVEELSGRSERADALRRRKPDHKTMQLCRQAERAIAFALAGECDDHVLRELYVESVMPAPDASRLLVCVVVTRSAGDGMTMEVVLQRLERAAGLLRAAVAQAVTRKRAPELTFLPLWAEEGRP